MKGLIVTQDHQLRLANDIPVPTPGEYDALVRVECAMICNGTDNEIRHGTLAEIRDYPVMLGHESAGHIIRVGKKVRNYQPGDLVSRTIVRTNEKYASGWGAFCEYGLVTDYHAMVSDGFTDAQRYTIGYMQGTYPDGISAEEACMMITFKEVYSAFCRMNLCRDDRIMIIGDGPVGLSMVQIAKMLGVKEIYLVGQNPDAMEFARKAGATEVFNDLSPADRSELKKRCARRITQYIDAVGLNKTTLQGQAFLENGGMINVYGLRSGRDLHLPLEGMLRNWGIRYMQFPIHALEGAAHKPICDAVLQKKLDARAMITHRLSIAEYQEGFDLIDQKKALKVVLYF